MVREERVGKLRSTDTLHHHRENRQLVGCCSVARRHQLSALECPRGLWWGCWDAGSTGRGDIHVCRAVRSHSVMSISNPMDCSPPGSSVPGASPGKNTGEGCHVLLQGIFPTQGSNPGLPHCRQILYHLTYQGSPRILEWVAYPFSKGSSWPRNQTRQESSSNTGDLDLSPWSGRFPGREWQPTPYFCWRILLTEDSGGLWSQEVRHS